MKKFHFVIVFFFFIALASCRSNNAKINNDLKKYFDSSNVEGSFSFLNNQLGNITVYNMKLDTTRLSTGTSFKIPATLIGLQTGKVINENSQIDSSKLTLKEAFMQSSVRYFQSLANAVGKDKMLAWMDSLSYGNKNIGSSLDSSWLDNDLKISPDEQLGLMSKLYFEQLPFQKYAQQTVENMMLQEDDSLYKLSYATGFGIDEKKNSFGWVTGWIEENRHIYFFVTYIKTPDNTKDLNAIGIKISKSILKEMGFFKGEK
ncbi:MAG: penicillin-binding transpeptidase domain-containing protein [Ginsengibacter sp.]